MTQPAAQPLLFAPFPPRKVILRALLVIVVIEAVSFGVHWRSLGFYHDDWVMLEIMHGQAGFWSRITALMRAGYGSRPLGLGLYSLLYSLGGLKPLLYQTYLMIQDVGAGCLFYLFFLRVLGRSDVALAAAALGLIYPIHPATHHWFSNSPQTAALCLGLASLLAHQRWLESRAHRWLAGSLLFYLLSLVCYESAILLPLLLGTAVLALRREAGAHWRGAAAAALRALAPYTAPLAAGIFWQRFGYPLAFHTTAAKSLRFFRYGFFSILKTYWDGLGCLTNEAAGLNAITFRLSRERFDGSQWLLWILFTGLAVGALRLDREKPVSLACLRLAGWLTAAVFLAAYAPYAASGYEPQIVGMMSRTNGTGAFAGGLLLALALAALSWLSRAGRAFQYLLLAAIVASFTCTNWYISSTWKDSWDTQRDVLKKAAAKISALPGPLKVMLKGVPGIYHGVVVFDDHWGFNEALRLETGRPDVSGDILTPWMSSQPEGLVELKGGVKTSVISYQGLYVYDYPADTLKRIVP